MSTVEVPGVIRAAAKDVWYWLVLRGVLVIAFGVVAFVWPLSLIHI